MKRIYGLLSLLLIVCAFAALGSSPETVCEMSIGSSPRCVVAREARISERLTWLIWRPSNLEALSEEEPVATLRALFSEIPRKANAQLAIDSRTAAKLRARLHSKDHLDANLSISVPGSLSAATEFKKTDDSWKRPRYGTKDGGFEYVVWHGVNIESGMTSQITATGNADDPYITLLVNSPKSSYFVYRRGLNNLYEYEEQKALPEDLSARTPSAKDGFDEAKIKHCTKISRGGRKEIKIIIIHPDDFLEEDDQWSIWEDFLRDSIRSVRMGMNGIPLYDVEIRRAAISNALGSYFTKNDYATLQDKMRKAQNIRNPERAFEILRNSRLYAALRRARAKNDVHLVILVSRHNGKRSESSTNKGADHARFFSLVSESQILNGTTLTHEIAHLLGAKHQLYEDPSRPSWNHAAIWLSKVKPETERSKIEKIKEAFKSKKAINALVGTADAIRGSDNSKHFGGTERMTFFRHPRFSGSEVPCEPENGRNKDSIIRNDMHHWDNASRIAASANRITSGIDPIVDYPSYCPSIEHKPKEKNCPDIHLRDPFSVKFNVGTDTYVNSLRAQMSVQTVKDKLKESRDAAGVNLNEMTVTVSGFASSEGSDERNWSLSYARATVAANSLLSELQRDGIEGHPTIVVCPFGALYADCFPGTTDLSAQNGSQRENGRSAVFSISSL